MANVNVTMKSDLRNLKGLQERITKVNLSKTLADKYAEILKQVISQRSPNSSGELAESVTVKKRGRYGSGVYAANHFWYANDGRLPGGTPPDRESSHRFEEWAAKNGWDVSALKAAIAKYGTKPTNYFLASKQILTVHKPRVYKKILKGK